MEPGDNRAAEEILRLLGERECVGRAQITRDAEHGCRADRVGEDGCGGERSIGLRREHDEVHAAHGRPDEDAFVCGDDAEAKALALELAAKVVAGRALDAGPLASARALEGLTAVIVNLNKRYKGHAGVRITGLP